VGWWRPWLLGLAFWAVLAPSSVRPRHSGNVWSRYMTIESIVERGTMAVERSPLRAISGSPDLIRSGGHFYSDKPPVLSALGAIVYAPLRALGWRFSVAVEQFTRVNWVLVSVFAGGGSILAVVGLRLLLQCAPLRAWVADGLTLVLALTSQLLVYGVTFNNHSVAAGCLTLALALVVLEGEPRRVSPRRFAAGLLAGLGAVVDLPVGGVMSVALAGLLVGKGRSVPWAYLAGLAGPFLLHAVLQFSVTGSPLPAEMTPEVFNYPGSYWLTEAGRWRETVPRWQFGLEQLFGPQGWLTVTPALVVGLAGIGRIATQRGDPLRPAAIALGSAIVVLLVYYTWGLRRTDIAGQSFGTRHLLALAPAVLAFGGIALARLGRWWLWVVFGTLVILGGVYAYAGMIDPWSRIERRSDSGLRLVKRLTIYPWSSYAR
jgi:hypothetical protein